MNERDKNEAVNEFLHHAMPVLQDAGYTFQPFDRRWLRPGGATGKDYHPVFTQIDDKTRISTEKFFRGSMLARLSRSPALMVTLYVEGPNENTLHFEIRLQGEGKAKMETIGPETLMQMISMLNEAAALKTKGVARLMRDFSLV